MPNERYWRQFEGDPFTRRYAKRDYGSAFITRPDMAHHIDHPDYWDLVRTLWAGRDVTLVGKARRVMPLIEARSVAFIEGPATQAYAAVDRLEADIGLTPASPVLLCLGATATVLALRLAAKGLWAIDAGHLGHFMPHTGAWAIDRDALISPGYLSLQKELHARPEGYGGSGHKVAAEVLAFARSLKAPRILDYGCGRGTMAKELRKLGCKADIIEYDPAIKGKDTLPKPAELVVCSDVLEHVEPDRLGVVLRHIRALTKERAFLLAATRPANKTLADGRNAHLILETPDWWLARVRAAGFRIDHVNVIPDHDVRMWCTPEPGGS